MGAKRSLVLTAMVFAVAMGFIDQTIVAIAIPNIQRELSLSATGAQWVINGYLLSLSALFLFGGRLGDVLGRRRMVIVGVIGFAVTSACCGLTPKGGAAEAWIVVFRVLQGAFAAILFPAAIAIVAAAFPKSDRGRGMALFFGITGGLTAIGPIAGGYLTQWTWRAIFWINIPVAIIALVLVLMTEDDTPVRSQSIDYHGTVLVSGGMGLLVLGLQQSSMWGWGSPKTIVCLLAGVVAIVAFLRWERSADQPLIRLEMFRDRVFSADTLVLGLISVVFVPFFFFASVYAQVSLGKSASNAGLYIMWFFLGFVIMAQIGGRMLDKRGVRAPVVIGSVLSGVGFILLAGKLTNLSLGAQSWDIALAGSGIGLMLGPSSTDALNRAPSANYSEVSGITQTSRNFGASVGLAILGTVLITRNHTNIASALTKAGVPYNAAHRAAAQFGLSVSSHVSGKAEPHRVVHAVQIAFAHSTQTVFYIMAGVLGATLLVGLRWLPRAVQREQATGSVPANEPAR